VGFHEGAKKVLVTPDHSRDVVSRRVDRAVAGIGYRTVRLHIVLENAPFLTDRARIHIGLPDLRLPLDQGITGFGAGPTIRPLNMIR